MMVKQGNVKTDTEMTACCPPPFLPPELVVNNQERMYSDSGTLSLSLPALSLFHSIPRSFSLSLSHTHRLNPHRYKSIIKESLLLPQLHSAGSGKDKRGGQLHHPLPRSISKHIGICRLHYAGKVKREVGDDYTSPWLGPKQ